MEVKMLAKGYKNNETFYQDFLEGKVNEKEEYFSGDVVYIKEAPDFPIYMGKGSEGEKKQDFLRAFKIASQSYINIGRDLTLDETFWHSLLVTKKRDFLLETYPQIENGMNVFHNIVLKKFDWENYIYKIIIGAQYIHDNIENDEERHKYYELIIDNLDLYNYIIKYEIFRNENFLLNILSIIDELNLSKVLKAKIKGREDLGDDERVGRRVIFEFNKSYPVVMSPMLDKENLKELFIEYLSYYHELSNEEEATVSSGERKKQEALVAVDPSNEYSRDSEPLVNAGMPSNYSLSVAEGIAEESDVQEVEQGDTLLAYLDKHQLEYVDHRVKGGSLWVIGDRSLEAYLKPLEVKGIRFRFKPTGGKASKNRPAWFWYGK